MNEGDSSLREDEKDYSGVVRVVFSLMSRGSADDHETSLFTNIPHEELVRRFRTYLDQHRHFFSSYHLEESHSLNEKGVDLLFRCEKTKIGFQIKSHYDVTRKNFAESVKRQLAESSVHRLDHYFILICAPLQVGEENFSGKIRHLLMELSLMETLNQTAYGPTNTVRLFQGLSPLTRDELIKHKIIDHKALYPDELGYEHLPELQDDADLTKARKRLDKFGDEWFESDQGIKAFQHYEELTYKKLGEQFERDYLPTIPPDTRQKRDGLVADVRRILDEARRTKSWRDRSESKLIQWIEAVPEEMIPYTSIPNLLRIKENLEKYRDIHLELDRGLEEAKDQPGGDLK